MLPDPSSPEAPKYWTLETSGTLRPAIERYLCRDAPGGNDVELIRFYLKQWTDSPAWDVNPNATEEGKRELAEARAEVNTLETIDTIEAFIGRLMRMGMDPL